MKCFEKSNFKNAKDCKINKAYSKLQFSFFSEERETMKTFYDGRV